MKKKQGEKYIIADRMNKKDRERGVTGKDRQLLIERRRKRVRYVVTDRMRKRERDIELLTETARG